MHIALQLTLYGHTCPSPIAASVLLAAAGSTSAFSFLVHFCPVRETCVWVERNESDAYGAEEMNYRVKWLCNLGLA